MALIIACIVCITNRLLQWVSPASISGRSRKGRRDGWLEVTKETEHHRSENLRRF